MQSACASKGRYEATRGPMGTRSPMSFLAFLVRIQREVVEVDPLIRSGLKLEPFDLLQRQSWECCLALIDFAGAETASPLLRVELSFFVIRDDSNVFVEVVVRDAHRTTAADLESTREDQRVTTGPHRGTALFGSLTDWLPWPRGDSHRYVKGLRLLIGDREVTGQHIVGCFDTPPAQNLRPRAAQPIRFESPSHVIRSKESNGTVGSTKGGVFGSPVSSNRDAARHRRSRRDMHVGTIFPSELHSAKPIPRIIPPLLVIDIVISDA